MLLKGSNTCPLPPAGRASGFLRARRRPRPFHALASCSALRAFAVGGERGGCGGGSCGDLGWRRGSGSGARTGRARIRPTSRRPWFRTLISWPGVLHAIWSSDFGAWMCFGGEGLYDGVTSGRVRKPCTDFEVVRPRSCRQTSGSEPSSEGFPPAWAILTDKSNGTRHLGLA